MAKLGNIHLLIDEFFTDTRMHICENRNCKYHADDGDYCKLKIICIDKTGNCKKKE